jgi:hypothetical protein
MNTKWIPAASIAWLLSILLGASDAHAERIVLLQFSGRKASAVREKVALSLKRAGHTVIRSGLSSRGIRPKTVKRVGKKADAVLGGRVESSRNGRDWKAMLSVRDAKTGTPFGEELEFSGDSLKELNQEVADNVAQRVETSLTGSEPQAPAPAEAEPVPEPVAEAPDLKAKVAVSPEAGLENENADEGHGSDAEVEDAGENAGASSGKRTIARLTGRAGYVRRDFDFHEDIYNHLRTQLSNIWVYRAQGEVYPFGSSLGERLGFVASYEGKLAGSVDDLDFQVEYPVLHSELFAGIRSRHPMGGHQLSGDLGFGWMEAGLDDANGAAGIPDTNYTFLRASVDYALKLGAFDVSAALGARLPLGYGEIGETRWFPRVGGYGFEAGLGVGYPLSPRWSLEAAGSLRRYVLNMNSEPEDALTGASEVAAGAVDLFASVYLGVVVAL